MRKHLHGETLEIPDASTLTKKKTSRRKTKNLDKQRSSEQRSPSRSSSKQRSRPKKHITERSRTRTKSGDTLELMKPNPMNTVNLSKQIQIDIDIADLSDKSNRRSQTSLSINQNSSKQSASMPHSTTLDRNVSMPGILIGELASLPTQKSIQDEVKHSEEKQWDNGDTYQGEWKDKLRHGNGVQRWADGTEYTGQWVRDLRHGEGCEINSRWTYEGNWQNGLWHGKGKLKLTTGETYDGNWKLNKRCG